MTASDFALSELQLVGYMLDKVYEGIDDKTLDLKIAPTAMTARELSEHLCECYVAAAKIAVGEKHDWGTFEAADKTWPALFEQMKDLRTVAMDACLNGTDAGLDSASHYMISHDNYHVGQLCTIRLAADADWNAYCIYQM